MSGERKPPLACRERPLNHEIRGKAERGEAGRREPARFAAEKRVKTRD